MKRRTTRPLSILLALCMVLMLLPGTAWAADATSGSCGDHVTWSFDESTGTLTISGTGDMKEYLTSPTAGGENPPWTTRYRSNILRVVVDEGITSLGSWAFYGCDKLTSVTLPGSLTRIGDMAFDDCISLIDINIPSSVTTLGYGVFNNCQSLTSITIPSSVTWIGDELFANCVSLISVPLSGGTRELAPAMSNNHGDNNYDLWASPVQSYLYQEGNDYVRVESIGGQLVVERYDESFHLLSSKNISSDLASLWGGFYAGENYNYVLTGQNNPDCSDDVEVFHIDQYDKSWNKVGQAGLFGADTRTPFYGGSARFAEADGTIYIHTSHQMYDGHQSNETIAIQESDMTITTPYFYVSHSFNQFVIADAASNLVVLDHGDAYPRAAVLQRRNYEVDVETLPFWTYTTDDGVETIAYIYTTDEVHLQTFPGAIGANPTGASLGGLAETSTGFVTAYNYDGTGGAEDGKSRNIFFTYTDKQNFSNTGTCIQQLTSYTGISSSGTPVVVPLGLQGGYILWSLRESNRLTGQISYASYDASGNVSDVITVTGALSDCQPLVSNGKAVWYVTKDSIPIFYVLDSSGLHTYGAGYTDVAENSWYYSAIKYVTDQWWMDSVNSTSFAPDINADRRTVVEALYRMSGSPSAGIISTFRDVSGTLIPAVSWATDKGIIGGYDNGFFGTNDPITREQFAAILYRYAAVFADTDISARSDLSRFEDARQISDWAMDAFSWANACGLISGTDNVTLLPKGNATRAQIATILMNFYKNIIK